VGRVILSVPLTVCVSFALSSCARQGSVDDAQDALVPPVIPVEVVATGMPASRASAPTAAQRARAARALILDQLRDPGTARFRNERVLQGGDVVCLEVAVDDGDFSKAVVITRPDRAPAVWIDRGRELVAHTACELA